MYMYMYIYICTWKTLRVIAVSAGDAVIFEQGGNQGIGKNHQDPTGNASFTSPGGSQRASGGLLGGPQGPLKHMRGVNCR